MRLEQHVIQQRCEYMLALIFYDRAALVPVHGVWQDPEELNPLVIVIQLDKVERLAFQVFRIIPRQAKSSCP
ncbi:hypothetical protein D3C80_2129000 [compost metagenome]